MRKAAGGDVRKIFVNDRPTDIDGLKYDRFANAIAAFLCDDDTTGPLSVSVQAPWGAGKSSLMKLIRKKLDRDAELVDAYASGRRARPTVTKPGAFAARWCLAEGLPD
jgi:hypothetical protein